MVPCGLVGVCHRTEETYRFYEDYNCLGCDTVQYGGCLPMIRRNVVPNSVISVNILQPTRRHSPKERHFHGTPAINSNLVRSMSSGLK
jgi:hypothetical protein